MKNTFIGKAPLFNLAIFFPRTDPDLNFKKNSADSRSLGSTPSCWGVKVSQAPSGAPDGQA